MENVENELFDQINPLSPDLKKLYTRHKKLEKEVEHLERYARYSTAAAIRHRELKKEKLREKERFLSLLAQHKNLDNYNTNLNT